jgi:heme exporter protein D
MSNHAAWLVLSFAIMVVAVLANVYEKLEQLEKRLNRLETGRASDDDGTAAHAAGAIAPEAFRRRDHRV